MREKRRWDGIGWEGMEYQREEKIGWGGMVK
jgi:hypothetical protein